jgi:metal-sulfur cluster biosynthetic enzyme
MPLRPDLQTPLERAVWARLESIIDPCSRASGAPAGLVSMGLVGAVTVDERPEGAHVRVTLYITEPGCIMGALFQLTAEQELLKLPGVSEVKVEVDYSHVWGPEQMAPEYRQRLSELRERRRRLVPASASDDNHSRREE